MPPASNLPGQAPQVRHDEKGQTLLKGTLRNSIIVNRSTGVTNGKYISNDPMSGMQR
jgi:hypothetical protein